MDSKIGRCEANPPGRMSRGDRNRALYHSCYSLMLGNKYMMVECRLAMNVAVVCRLGG